MATRPSDPLTPLSRRPEVVALARAAGRTSGHLVGGCLRDRLLALSSPDLDAVVAGRGGSIARLLARDLGGRLVELGGDRFAAFRVVAGGAVLDLWDRGRNSLLADLERRDLTINSFALSLKSGRVSDPFAGRQDLELRRLRATSAASFSADPLRVLRLARFAITLPGFSIEPATLALAREAAGSISPIAPERVREELRRLFGHPAGDQGAAALAAVGLYPRLWTGDLSRRRVAASARALERLEARCRRLDTLAGPIEVDRFSARMAALFETLGRAGGRTAETVLADLLARGYLAAGDARRVRALLASPPLPGSRRERRWFLHSAGAAWPTTLAYLGSRLETAEQVRDWERTATELGGLAADPEIFSPPPLLDGHEIRERLGVEPGPLLGRLTKLLRRAQIEGRVSSRRQALELLRAELRPGGPRESG